MNESFLIGVSGHQSMSEQTATDVSAAIKSVLSTKEKVIGVSSLAVGADQIFARAVLDSGRPLHVVIPSKNYEKTFSTQDNLAEFYRLLALAEHVKELDFDSPTESAFFAAGKAIVDSSQLLVAIWDGEPAAGLGGTADVVSYAREQGRNVIVIWPKGASRN
jgi:imidazoleglycerol phosphate dehydratase HisB